MKIKNKLFAVPVFALVVLFGFLTASVSQAAQATVTLSLSPSSTVYNNGDTVSLTANVSFSGLDPSVQTVYVAEITNNALAAVSSFSVTTNTYNYTGITIGASTGFQNGSNTIVVKVFPSQAAYNSGQGELGEGSVSLQVQGINPGPTPGTTNPGPTPGTTNPGPTPATTPATNCSLPQNVQSPNCLYNPLPTGDFTTFVLLIMKWILGIIGIFAVLFIMIGGFRMITSQGNEEAYGVAKKTVTYAVIGLVVAVLSFSMIAIVENLLQANITNVNTTTQTTSP